MVELQQLLPFTVLKLTDAYSFLPEKVFPVATALTVYGIETVQEFEERVQQLTLQQCLPFTVLKRSHRGREEKKYESCNSAYRLRY